MSKKDWEKSEETACGLYDGVRTPASGSKGHSKLDVIVQSGPLEGFRIENKWSEKESFRVSKKLLSKVRKQAAVTGSKAFLRVDLQGAEVYCTLRESDLLELINRLDASEAREQDKDKKINEKERIINELRAENSRLSV